MDSQETQTEEAALPRIDPEQLKIALDQMRSEQNLPLGLIAGLAAAAVGAALWAVVTVVTHFQIGFMAVGVGFLVGLAVRFAGKGIDTSFGVMGAALALLGCLAGNLLAVCGLIAAQENMGFFEVLSQLDFVIIKDLMLSTFSPIDLVFYGIAVYEAYRLAFRNISQEEIARRISGGSVLGT